jgi:hypothetical protein
MSIGSSGRVVVELDPQLKRQLYSALAARGMSLKEWLVLNAKQFLCDPGKNPSTFEAENALEIPLSKVTKK